MPHFRVDDALHSHPKAQKAGDEALGMWSRAGSYCMAYLTDGFVPEWWVKLQPRGMAKAKKLIEAGFWHGGAERDGEQGFQFHQFVGPGRQDSRAQVEADREKWRKKKQRQREATDQESLWESPEVSPGGIPQRFPGITQPNPTQQEKSGYLPESATDSNARDSVAATPGADLVRRVIPETIPGANRTMLRIKASALLNDGTPADVVEEALQVWLTKTDVGPGILPSLAADVVKRRNGHATKPVSKLRGIAELAQEQRAAENRTAAKEITR